jgi:hypothetical protein
MRMPGIRVAIARALIAIALTLVAVLSSCRSVLGPTRAGFWFDEVTFALTMGQADALGGQLTAEDVETIKRVALSELRAAYADYRIEVSDGRDALYSVRVVNDAPRYGGAAQSIALGALGGRGFVSYPVIAGYAISYAPAHADRRAIIEAIGRGLGRAAAHELAHQLVSHVNIHASRDPESYEFDSADRVAEYYGPIHWDIAKPDLAKTLGQASASASASPR